MFRKTNDLNCAILQYALCFDLLWQIAWAFVTPSSFENLCDREPEKLEKNCTRDDLQERLGCNISQNPSLNSIDRKIQTWFAKYDNDNRIKEIRDLNNYIKHRGTIAYVGFNENPRAIGNVDLGNGKVAGIKFLQRKKLSVEETER